MIKRPEWPGRQHELFDGGWWELEAHYSGWFFYPWFCDLCCLCLDLSEASKIQLKSSNPKQQNCRVWSTLLTYRRNLKSTHVRGNKTLRCTSEDERKEVSIRRKESRKHQEIKEQSTRQASAVSITCDMWVLWGKQAISSRKNLTCKERKQRC